MANLEIQIIEVNEIDDGVEIFARAWQDTVQIGFGMDGTVDIERFRIMNPPLLVDDPNGDIVHQSQYEDPDNPGQFIQSERRLREDPEEAILQVLENTIRRLKNKHGSQNIIEGKRGNTTTVLYPGAGDGWLGHFSGGTWADDHDATSAESGQLDYTTAETEGVNVNSVNMHIRRAYFPFDTSSIPDGDTISAASFSAYVWSASTAGAILNGVNVFESPQASTSVLVNTEYNFANWGTTALATELTAATSGNWLDFTLNASGIALIDKTGNTFLGVMCKNDYTNTAPAAGAGRSIYQRFRYSEYTGTASDPVLTIEHAGAASTFVPRVYSFM